MTIKFIIVLSVIVQQLLSVPEDDLSCLTIDIAASKATHDKMCKSAVQYLSSCVAAAEVPSRLFHHNSARLHFSLILR